MTYNRSAPHFPVREFAPEDTLAAELELQAEHEARAADEPIRFTEEEAKTILAALRQLEEPRPGVYSASLKVESWLLAR